MACAIWILTEVTLAPLVRFHKRTWIVFACEVWSSTMLSTTAKGEPVLRTKKHWVFARLCSCTKQTLQRKVAVTAAVPSLCVVCGIHLYGVAVLTLSLPVPLMLYNRCNLRYPCCLCLEGVSGFSAIRAARGAIRVRLQKGIVQEGSRASVPKHRRVPSYARK